MSRGWLTLPLPSCPAHAPPFKPKEEVEAFREYDRLRARARAQNIPAEEREARKRVGLRQRNFILERNLGLVWGVAHIAMKRTRSACLEVDDLFGYGVLGCVIAIEKFEVERGHKFSTYGSHWIYQSIYRSIADTDLLVRLPVHIFDTKTRSLKTERAFETREGRRPTVEEVAERTGIPTSKLDRARRVSFGNAMSLDTPISSESEMTRLEMLTSKEEHPVDVIAREEREKLAGSLIASLTEREKFVVMGRAGGDTLTMVGQKLSRTRERVRQIESSAMNKLRKIARLRGVSTEPQV